MTDGFDYRNLVKLCEKILILDLFEESERKSEI